MEASKRSFMPIPHLAKREKMNIFAAMGIRVLAFVLGMLVHWLPDRFKRRYRIWFSRMPLGVMAAAVLLAIFIIYQFITAGLQSFIYFQF